MDALVQSFTGWCSMVSFSSTSGTRGNSPLALLKRRYYPFLAGRVNHQITLPAHGEEEAEAETKD